MVTCRPRATLPKREARMAKHKVSQRVWLKGKHPITHWLIGCTAPRDLLNTTKSLAYKNKCNNSSNGKISRAKKTHTYLLFFSRFLFSHWSWDPLHSVILAVLSFLPRDHKHFNLVQGSSDFYETPFQLILAGYQIPEFCINNNIKFLSFFILWTRCIFTVEL